MANVTIPYKPRKWAKTLHSSFKRFFSLIIHRRGGKAQPLSAKILTPDGFVFMKDIRVGSKVLTPNGKAVEVIGVFPQGWKQIYGVRMADGSKTRATADHLWKIHFGNRKRNDKIVDTKYLRNFLERENIKSKRIKSRPLLDCVGQIDFGQDRDIILDSYLLGLLIGDGCFSGNSRISSADKEIIEYIKTAGFETSSKIGKCDYYIKGILPLIGLLGLKGKKSFEKIIPSQYINASRETRIALLQGLMDTDGSAARGYNRSRIEFSTTSQLLAKQVQYLCRSLGMLASCADRKTFYTYKNQKKIGRISYRISIRTANGIAPFRLKRKLEKVSQYRFEKSRNAIVEIYEDGFEEAQCILIDDKEHQYITDDFIITHNTTALINHLQRAAVDDKWESNRMKSLVPNISEEHLKILLRDRFYGIVYPTYQQAELVAWQMLKYYALCIPGTKANEVDLEIRYPGGSRLRLFGADKPDRLRGPAFWGLGFDEYSQQPSNIFSEILSKGLADHLGFAIFAGTIKGKNQLYRTHLIAKQNLNEWDYIWQDIDYSLEHEEGITIEMLRIALEDDKKLIVQGLMTQEEFDQEWYLSSESAVKGAYYSKEIVKARKEGRIGMIPYDRAIPVHVVVDLGVGPRLACGFYQRINNRVQKIDYWEGIETDGIPELVKMLQTKPYIYGKYFAPHDIKATDISTGKTRLETAEKLGVKFEVIPRGNVDDRINAGKLLFNRLWVDESNCQVWLDYIIQYRQKWDDKKGMFLEEPYHDFTSHAADELGYAAIIEDEMTNDETKPFKQEPYKGRDEYDNMYSIEKDTNIDPKDFKK